MSSPPFCLLAAGNSTRSGGRWHKALLPVGRQAVISHILGGVPADSPVVVVLGHQGRLIQDYLELAHPERDFTFVPDPEYGNGPGISLRCAREHLQQPFFIACCDSVISIDPLVFREIQQNWIAVAATVTPERYATVWVEEGRVLGFVDKKESGWPWAFTGLAAIHDWEFFWYCLERHLEGGGTNFIHTLHEVGIGSRCLEAVPVSWYDVGTPEGYREMRDDRDESWVLEKDVDELTYQVGQRCVKLYLDAERCLDKCWRGSKLSPVIPPRLDLSKEFGFSYAWVPGATIYHCSNLSTWRRLWDWLERVHFRQWTPFRLFKDYCRDFYEEKTRERYAKLAPRLPVSPDRPLRINGKECRPLAQLVAKIPWEWLAEGVSCPFHGDLHPDNIILREDGGFVLVDWRSDFAGRMEGGDLYYDLGKMYSGLCISYHRALTQEPDLLIGKEGDQVWYSPIREPYLFQIAAAYEEWLEEQGYDLRRVRLVSALVHLNIAPLHTPPLEQFLAFNAWVALESLID